MPPHQSLYISSAQTQEQSVGPVENENVLLISSSLACIDYVALGNGKLIKHFRAGVLFIFHFISFFFVCVCLQDWLEGFKE